MPQRKRKPTSPGRRFQTVADFSDITKTVPERSLTEKKTSTGGRNNYGRMTSRASFTLLPPRRDQAPRRDQDPVRPLGRWKPEPGQRAGCPG